MYNTLDNLYGGPSSYVNDALTRSSPCDNDEYLKAIDAYPAKKYDRGAKKHGESTGSTGSTGPTGGSGESQPPEMPSEPNCAKYNWCIDLDFIYSKFF